MAKERQYQVVAEGKGDRARAYYLTAASSEDEARERVQATEFALWMSRSEDAPTGREDQAEPYKVSSVEAA